MTIKEKYPNGLTTEEILEMPLEELEEFEKMLDEMHERIYGAPPEYPLWKPSK